MIVGSCWNLFSFEAFNMALLLLAFEQWFQERRWYLFPVAIFLICISQPFNLYVYGLFLACYALLRHVQTGQGVKKLLMCYAQMAGLSIIGALVSAPFLIQNILQLVESPRGSGANSYSNTLSSLPVFSLPTPLLLATSIWRFFSSDMAGHADHFNGWTNYLEAPLFYCGLPCLLLMPQVFPTLSRKMKVFFGVFITVWLLPIVFPYFRFAFWLFTGDYFRAYSFFVCFFFLFYSVYALEHIVRARKVNVVVLGVTLAVLYLLLNYPYLPDTSVLRYPDSPTPEPALYFFASVMLAVYAVLLFLMGWKKQMNFLPYLFVVLIIVEVGFLSWHTVNNMEQASAAEMKEKTGYNDYTVDAVNYLNQTDHSFYRIDKGYYSTPAQFFSLNDGMVQGYRSTSVYNPFNQQYYVFYLQTMGVASKESEIESRWAMGLSGRPLLESENGVKYMLVKKEENPFWKLYCDSIATFGDVKVLRNRYVLPPGYTYSQYVRERAFNSLSRGQKDFISLCACVIGDDDVAKAQGMQELSLQEAFAHGRFDSSLYREKVTELSKDALAVSTMEDTRIDGKITVDKNKMMYLAMPYDKGWKLKVDGKDADVVMLNGGMTGLMLSKGAHTMELHYELRYMSLALMAMIAGVALYAGGVWYYRKQRKGYG
jgi:uncharacterized membrane protein YfhO